MWRDILIIAAFGLAVLTYLGLTPGRLSTYVETAKGGIAKRSLYQKVFLFLMIALTVIFIFIVIWRSGTFELADFLMGIAIFTFSWCIILTNAWKLSERGEKVANIVLRSVMLPSLVASIILSDMLLWQKLVYPLGGGGIGYSIAVLRAYIRKKRADRRPSKEGNK